MSDPFDVLRLPPRRWLRPDFAAAAGPTRHRPRRDPRSQTMPTGRFPHRHRRRGGGLPGRRPRCPVLVVADGRAALAWYQHVFGGSPGETVEMPTVASATPS